MAELMPPAPIQFLPENQLPKWGSKIEVGSRAESNLTVHIARGATASVIQCGTITFLDVFHAFDGVRDSSACVPGSSVDVISRSYRATAYEVPAVNGKPAARAWTK